MSRSFSVWRSHPRRHLPDYLVTSIVQPAHPIYDRHRISFHPVKIWWTFSSDRVRSPTAVSDPDRPLQQFAMDSLSGIVFLWISAIGFLACYWTKWSLPQCVLWFLSKSNNKISSVCRAPFHHTLFFVARNVSTFVQTSHIWKIQFECLRLRVPLHTVYSNPSTTEIATFHRLLYFTNSVCVCVG